MSRDYDWIGGRSELAPEIVSSMHAFRHEIFVRRLGWSLPLVEGVERDQYDNEDAVYFIARDPTDSVTACARLLPTIKKCLLSELAEDLLGHNPPPCDPLVWELSRFATNVRKSGEGRVLSLSQPTLDLLAAIIEFARRHEIRQLVLATSVAIERLLIRAGFDVHRLAAPRRMPDGLFVVIFIEVAVTSAAPEMEDVAYSPGYYTA
ncbi:MAG: acyl-homoserine-lactone synthase [Steroidobacteraceae bacterium]